MTRKPIVTGSQQQVLDALTARGPMTNADLMEVLGRDRRTIYGATKALRDAGVIETRLDVCRGGRHVHSVKEGSR